MAGSINCRQEHISFRRRCSFVAHTGQLAFLDAYAKLGTNTFAAKATGINRSTHYEWPESDLDYATAFEQAHEEYKDRIVQALNESGIFGRLRPIYYKGKKIGDIREHDTRAPELFAKARIPEKFRDRFDVGANVTGGVLVVPGIMNLDEWAKAAKRQQEDLMQNKKQLQLPPDQTAN